MKNDNILKENKDRLIGSTYFAIFLINLIILVANLTQQPLKRQPVTMQLRL